MYKEGDVVKIIANTSDHHFTIGEEVVLCQITSDDFIAYNGTHYYFVNESDFEFIRSDNTKK